MQDMELMTPLAVARRLGKSEHTVRGYAMTGRLPFITTTTGRRLFHRKDVEEFARKHPSPNAQK